MKQKIFLTSALAMGFVAPAFAEDFPSNGLMQQNKTYDNAATSTNMDGVYEGTVNAVAEYDIIDYIVNAGQYLPADSETVITCPAGSFCPGISGNVQYNQTTAQGIQTCPTGYASSAAGASVNTQCYRACDINNMGTNGSIANIAHATAISGNDYYGNGTDTCEPTSCENGWHKADGFNIASIIGDAEGDDYVENESDGSLHYDYGLSAEDTGIVGESYAFVVKFTKLEGTGRQSQWVEKGYVYGHGRCSKQPGQTYYNEETYTTQTPTMVSSLNDDTGQPGAVHCYCSVSGYKANENAELQSLTSSWIYSHEADGNEAEITCSSSCAGACARVLGRGNNYADDEYGFRNALFSTVPVGLATCDANTITINWSDASAADISANNAGTATYGSDVRTPVKAQTIKGKTFRGWRFSKPEQTTTGN